MHNNCSGSPEPSFKCGDTRQFISFSNFHVGTGLEQMLLHVIHEIIQQLDLFLNTRWELVQIVVVFLTFVIDVVNVPADSLKFSIAKA